MADQEQELIKKLQSKLTNAETILAGWHNYFQRGEGDPEESAEIFTDLWFKTCAVLDAYKIHPAKPVPNPGAVKNPLTNDPI